MTFDQLNPREQRLVILFGVAVAALAVVLVPYRVLSYLAAREKQNLEYRSAIAEVNAARPRIAARKAERGDVAARYARKAPALGTLVDTAQKTASLEIGTQSDTPPVPRGKLYMERSTRLTIQKTGLRPLATFLELLEQSGHPVAVTQMSIVKRMEPDSYTVNLTVSAYDRTEAPAAPPPATTASTQRGAVR